MFEGQYVLWGGEHSLFTRKLQAMLNYLGVSYAFKLKSEASQAAVEARLGTHFIPGLETPEGWFLHDTTPIGLMLNHKYPDRPLLPKTPVQKIAAHLLEDWADEWFGRYAINSRWCYPDNVAAIAEGFYANRIGRFQGEGLSPDEQQAAAVLIQTIRDNFGLRACGNRGCGPDQSAQVRADFDILMQYAAAHFSEQPYLLGDCRRMGANVRVGTRSTRAYWSTTRCFHRVLLVHEGIYADWLGHVERQNWSQDAHGVWFDRWRDFVVDRDFWCGFSRTFHGWSIRC